MSASQKVTFPSENKAGDCPGILCGDPTKISKGLIVLQEWWGLNQQIQDCGKDLCGEGNIVTLVPDLYRGKVAVDRETAGHLMGDLDWPGAVADIRACAKYLKSQGCKKVGVTGFCMGGALALAAAVLVEEVDAAVPFYGIPGAQLCDVTKVRVPLQCHFGEKDDIQGFSTPKEWRPLKEKLEKSCKTLEFYVYDAGHAFTHKSGPNYKEADAKQAFKRMFEFLNKHLA